MLSLLNPDLAVMVQAGITRLVGNWIYRYELVLKSWDRVKSTFSVVVEAISVVPNVKVIPDTAPGVAVYVKPLVNEATA